MDLSSELDIQWRVIGPADGENLLIDDVECVKAPEQRICDAEYCEYIITSQFDFAYAGDGWTIANESDGDGNIYGHFYDANNDKTYFGMLNAVAPAGGGWAGAGINVENLNQCRILSYKYKGFEHDLTFQNEPANGDPSYGMLASASDSWREVTFDLSNLKGTDLGASLNIRWQKHSAGNGSLYIDDVKCVLESSNPVVTYEAYSVEDFEDNSEKKSVGDYVFAWGKLEIGNTTCGNDCYEFILPDAANTGTNGAALTGIALAQGDQGQAVIDIMVPNLTGCKTLKYRYKGIGHYAALVMNKNADFPYLIKNFSSKTDWKTAYVLVQDYNLGEVSDIRFIVDDLTASDPNYLYIDDVECVLEDPPIELPEPNAPTTNTQLVDDFEDGDEFPLWNVGNWWVDKAGSATKDTTKFAKGSQSSKSLQVNFVLDGAGIDYDPYMAISSNDFGDMNLTNCTAVSYDYKGAAHKFRIKFSWQINDLLGLGWNFHSFEVANRSESWQTVTIPLSSLRQQWCDENECNWGRYIPLDTIMRRVNGFDWRVDGVTGTHDSLAIDNIRCIGLAEPQYYTVTFKNGEETYAEKSWAEGSNVPDPEGTPTKDFTAQYAYTFNYWAFDEYEFDEDEQQFILDANGKRIPIRRVTADAIHEAVYDSVTRAYTITFLMDDGSTLATNYDVDYGTSIADFAPVDLTKAATDEYTYVFAGWSPDTTGVTVTGDASFTAVFNGTKNQYCITFVDDDGTTLKAEECYDYGTLVADIDVPTVQDKSASVTWLAYDGSVLHQDYLADGATLDVYLGPERPATAEWTYTFTGWSPTVVTQVSSNATYTATYSAEKNQYYVAFVDENGDEIGAASEVYDYGTNVSSIAPTATKAGNAQWTYTFTGWSPAITNQTIVTGEVTYTAVFSATENSYTVAFDAGEGAQNVPVARTAVYGTNIASLLPAEDPFKAATDASTFEFVKWTYSDGTDIGEDDELVGDVTLKAVFAEFVRRYAVTFIDYDNTVLKAATLYDYGATVVVPDEDPTRAPAGIYTYDFHGWTPAVVPVEGEAIYKATYDSTAHYGAIAISVIDGKETATIDGSYTDGDVVNIPASIDVDTVVFNRTFSASGYSTIMLPFSINRNAVEGASRVLAFSGIGLDSSGKKQVEMTEVNGELSAYTPYMVELESEGNLVFRGDTMVIQPTEGANTAVRSADGWEFRGTLSKIVWDENHPDLGRVYGFSGKETDKIRIGQFVKAAAGAWITPFRAYMIYDPNGNSAGKSTGYAYVGAEPLPDYMDVVVVNRSATGEESKTVIGGLNTRTGEFKMLQNYDLKGRKLNGKPTARGVYYGKKKVIK